MYREWKRLVTQHEVRGAKVHDTRLVAAMNVHGIRRITTFNVGDFTRFNIEVLFPSGRRRTSYRPLPTEPYASP